jgi:hypothetical protein
MRCIGLDSFIRSLLLTIFVLVLGRLAGPDWTATQLLGGRFVVSGVIYWSQYVEGSVYVGVVYIGY